MQSKDWVYWALLVGVIYELAKTQSAPASTPNDNVGGQWFAPSSQSSCCDPCNQRPDKVRRQADARPAWVMDLASGNGSPFIIEGVS